MIGEKDEQLTLRFPHRAGLLSLLRPKTTYCHKVTPLQTQNIVPFRNTIGAGACLQRTSLGGVRPSHGSSLNIKETKLLPLKLI